MSGHPQGHYEDGYGHPQQTDSYYQDDQNQAYYDQQQQQHQHGGDGYYDEGLVLSIL